MTERIDCIECAGQGDLPDLSICEMCEGEGVVCKVCLMPDHWCTCDAADEEE